ncbi:hypothetical protein K443DRAFT_684484 [Laccaria amethystina LaAM-08-1]|uniref:NB-ARC domain-containing protein n=1 Tax=Laccaria amethystina LaAM-08-1 TaxID=1095629 RepID=A0A0C9WIT4_9AGAR|nr:hypothetical protein K443DRAFT_684484 [Laccaria amethystina LaAM-08-1]
MSGASFFAGARHFVARDNTFIDINIHTNYGNSATSDGVISLMPNPSTRFTGRTEVIAKLKRHFFTNTNDAVQKRKFFLLYGMGGIGKTQICLKFVEEMSGSFSRVFWVDASSSGTIIQALKVCSLVDWLSERELHPDL